MAMPCSEPYPELAPPVTPPTGVFIPGSDPYPEPAPVATAPAGVPSGVVMPGSDPYPEPAPVAVAGVVVFVPVFVHPATTRATASTRTALTARMVVRLVMAPKGALIV